MRTGGARVGLAVSGLALLAGLAMPAQAAGPSIAVTSTVAGHSLKDAGANSPIALHPTDSTVVRVEVTNNGTSPVQVRAVRLDARVLGLAFFSYTTRVDLTVAPGTTGTRAFALDLGDLDGQATGLLPAELSLIAPDRTVLASEKGTVDVKGKIGSVYGVFGLAVGAVTAVLLISLISRLLRRTLPDSRWSRALRFAVPGLGLGLVATFTLGVLRITVPSLGTSLGLLLSGLVVGFVLGYLTPSPDDEADRDELDERDILTPVPVVPPVRDHAPTPPTAPRQPAAPLTQAPDTDPGLGILTPPAAPVRPEAPSAQDPEDNSRQTRLAGPATSPPA